MSAKKKKLLLGILFPSLLVIWLFGGYYIKYGEWTSEAIFFIKKYPTLQIKFKNILYENDDLNHIGKINDRRRGVVIDYCKYRLGIITSLKTQEDLERCKAL